MICTLKFIAVLFTVAKNGNGLCPSIDEWIKKLQDGWMEGWIETEIFIHKNKLNLASCDTLNEFRRNYAK